MPLAFLKLPPELVRAIMSHLSLDDILALKLSCKRLSYLVHEPQLEHYRIRIQEAGLRDRSPPGGLSIRERVTALSRWESAWENISVSAADPFSDPVARHHHYHHYHHRHHVVEIEESDPDRQVMVVEDFYIELCPTVVHRITGTHTWIFGLR
ncbi:hypothetical protein B0F90DRAFT_915460 [Multifurca ochricompacta]|uniref:F-box domain-containing protein n=1 Tax=Multifurca ochricompacta TaxID=376703 RepID=A0AAD4QLP9_9AGAM|nr:hypothetical protein B0F90DRAFT_915460 [Multifurca ochricompacta]